MKFRELIRRPEKTTYIVMVRNYADMLWSSYNFWCKPPFDGDCEYSKWAVAGVHVRTPELFHSLVEADAAYNTSVNDPLAY
ncbi:hypothetical protein B484DRAFT_411936 [Ochromonadaceae sp. CCMP2298]|nr:hypothetical protein B484DRAFT_411936 [Ochromonadaceae sp. CCMP2298]